MVNDRLDVIMEGIEARLSHPVEGCRARVVPFADLDAPGVPVPHQRPDDRVGGCTQLACVGAI
jgi:hypothetical protein